MRSLGRSATKERDTGARPAELPGRSIVFTGCRAQPCWVQGHPCKKNGGHLKRGGTLQCPPVRSGRPRTLRTEPGWLGGTDQPEGCQSRVHPYVETIRFGDYSIPKKSICTDRRPD